MGSTCILVEKKMVVLVPNITSFFAMMASAFSTHHSSCVKAFQYLTYNKAKYIFSSSKQHGHLK